MILITPIKLYFSLGNNKNIEKWSFLFIDYKDYRWEFINLLK